jgi:hypothetical protein
MSPCAASATCAACDDSRDSKSRRVGNVGYDAISLS